MGKERDVRLREKGRTKGKQGRKGEKGSYGSGKKIGHGQGKGWEHVTKRTGRKMKLGKKD